MILHHKNVTEAAMDAGFADLSYFTKLFKRTKGITPREYMKKPKHRGTQLWNEGLLGKVYKNISIYLSFFVL